MQGRVKTAVIGLSPTRTGCSKGDKEDSPEIYPLVKVPSNSDGF